MIITLKTTSINILDFFSTAKKSPTNIENNAPKIGLKTIINLFRVAEKEQNDCQTGPRRPAGPDME